MARASQCAEAYDRMYLVGKGIGRRLAFSAGYEIRVAPTNLVCCDRCFNGDQSAKVGLPEAYSVELTRHDATGAA